MKDTERHLVLSLTLPPQGLFYEIRFTAQQTGAVMIISLTMRERNVFGDLSDFDGQHGLSAYNKTDQEKFEDSDSTFISPKFV